MNFHLLVVVGTLLATGNTLNTVLNVEEITSIHYAVDIIEQPVSREQHLEGEVISVVNKHGQEFVCSLPSVSPTDADSKGDENILDQLVDISGLLKPMETAPCLIKTVDWWTYEFCYGSVIKQYHLEDNKASGPILILGKYESEYNWKNSSETKNRLQRFHSQFYVNGTKCDLTGEPRRTEVRFHCEDGVGDYIQRVDEPESCRYVVTVATTRVCHHPYLRLQAVRTPHAITCAPVISEEQYLRYVDYQERKTKEEESLKEKWLKQNEELTHESEMGESQSMLEPVSPDSSDDDELKMSIKIFRLYPVKKQKNAQASEAKEDVMGVETQITLEENDLEMKVEDINLSTETETSGKEPVSSEYETDIDKNTDIPENAGEAATKDLFSGQDNLHIVQYSDVENPYLTEESQTEDEDGDEDEVDDEDDLVDDMDRKEKVLTQASKSTNRDHFSKLLRRLKQLGNMFMNQEGEENARPGNEDRISELQHVVDSIKDGHIKQLEQEVKEWTKNLLNKDTLPDMDDEDLEEEEQRLGTSLSSLMDALDKAENKLSIAKKEMETLEEFLDSQLKEMEHTATHNKESEETGTQDKLEWEYQDPTEGMSQTPETLQSDVEGTMVHSHHARPLLTSEDRSVASSKPLSSSLSPSPSSPSWSSSSPSSTSTASSSEPGSLDSTESLSQSFLSSEPVSSTSSTSDSKTSSVESQSASHISSNTDSLLLSSDSQADAKVSPELLAELPSSSSLSSRPSSSSSLPPLKQTASRSFPSAAAPKLSKSSFSSLQARYPAPSSSASFSNVYFPSAKQEASVSQPDTKSATTLTAGSKTKRHSSPSPSVAYDNPTGRNLYPSLNLGKVSKRRQRKLRRSNVIQGAGQDPTNSKSIMKNADKKFGGTRQLNILKNKVEDESQKSKLEQTIKDRLQKLGLERLGRKVEVKILTPNSLEEEDSNNLLLSQEETEAFQNMIVNLLSANAEELEEREHHRKLEKNYGFRFNDDKETEEDE